MEPNQYRIVAKEIKGISLIGFTIENTDGNKKIYLYKMQLN